MPVVRSSSPQWSLFETQRLTPGEIDSKRVFHVTVEFELGGGGNSDVVLTGSVEAISQQYGFSTIPVTGLTLHTRRTQRKARLPQQASEESGSASSSLLPTIDASDATQACDSVLKEIHA
jgi:hypothetical protein